MAYYTDHRYDQTGPYDGVPELLDALAAARVPMAVLSNKPDAAAVDMVQRLFGRWSFAATRGQREGCAVKPDPAGALAVAAEVGVPAERWIYVGDSDVDMLTARAAGFYAVGVAWGFRGRDELVAAGADVVVETPGEILGGVGLTGGLMGSGEVAVARSRVIGGVRARCGRFRATVDRWVVFLKAGKAFSRAKAQRRAWPLCLDSGLEIVSPMGAGHGARAVGRLDVGVGKPSRQVRPLRLCVRPVLILK